MNRALVLVPTDAGDELEVLAAIGPLDRTEADRVWRSIERDGPDLETLYEVGARTLSDGSALANTIVGARLTRDARRIDGKAFAIAVYKKAKPGYHPMTQASVEKALGL